MVMEDGAGRVGVMGEGAQVPLTLRPATGTVSDRARQRSHGILQGQKAQKFSEQLERKVPVLQKVRSGTEKNKWHPQTSPRIPCGQDRMGLNLKPSDHWTSTPTAPYCDLWSF